MRSFKIIDHPKSERVVIKKKIEKEVKHGIYYATAQIDLHFPPQ